MCHRSKNIRFSCAKRWPEIFIFESPNIISVNSFLITRGIVNSVHFLTERKNFSSLKQLSCIRFQDSNLHNDCIHQPSSNFLNGCQRLTDRSFLPTQNVILMYTQQKILVLPRYGKFPARYGTEVRKSPYCPFPSRAVDSRTQNFPYFPVSSIPGRNISRGNTKKYDRYLHW